MSWLVDGSNVLGRMRLDRHAPEAKRELVRLAAAFSRAKRSKVTVFFDGPEPDSFGKHLGSVTVVFSGRRSADELIVERALNVQCRVVTSDRAMAARVAGRRVTIVDCETFVRDLESVRRDEPGSAGDDWVDYFSDPKNRNVF